MCKGIIQGLGYGIIQMVKVNGIWRGVCVCANEL